MKRTQPPRLSHLQRLTDPRGLIHAASNDFPDRFSGYDTVDNADALRLCALASDTVSADDAGRLGNIYFNYLTRARLEDGRVRHACSATGTWTSENDDEFVQARLARALATVMVSELPIRLRLAAANWWRELLPQAAQVHTALAAGNWLSAFGQLRSADPGRDLDRVEALANWLMEDCYYAVRSSDWEWFEPQWRPTAACIPAGLWHAYGMLNEQRYAAVARITTDFLADNLFENGTVAPAGTGNAWRRQGEKETYDQLPADVCSIVKLFVTAARLGKSEIYRSLAEQAAGWFTGNNLRSQSLICAETGGCADAIRRAGIDRNQGATAIVSYLLAEAAIHMPVHAKEDASVYCTLG